MSIQQLLIPIAILLAALIVRPKVNLSDGGVGSQPPSSHC